MIGTKFKFLLLIGFLMIQIGPALACKCFSSPNFSVKEVSNYDYVAWIKVKGIKPSQTKTAERNFQQNYNWAEIEELHRFKGTALEKLKVRGGHRELGFRTSCDFGMEVGEEWLLFANELNGDLMVEACSRSEKYRDKDGFRDWFTGRGITILTLLDSAFNQGKLDIKQLSKDTLFFTNGQIERIKLSTEMEGIDELNYFTPNGILIGTEHLKNGLRHGLYSWNYKKGTRLTQENYKNGVKVGMSYFWSESNPDKPTHESYYDDQGQFRFFKEYVTGTNGRRLSYEVIFDTDKNKLIHRFYDELGNVKSEED